jgi:FdhD protein
MDLGPRSLDSPLDVPTGATAVTHAVVKVQGRRARAREDQLTVEEPLEIRLAGHSLSVTMRTPGHDEELVAGLLFAERIIADADDIDVIAHYPGPSDEPELANVVNVLLRSSAPSLRERRARSFVTSSACGLCGRTTVEDILANVPPITSDITVPVERFYELEPALSAAQSTFAKTGGLHAAGLFDTDGQLRILREDVGRHNAVDKVVGHMLRARELPLDRCILLVSGRAGFEIVQKALVAGIPIVASVSAPSSLAVQLALAGGLTLIGFLRQAGLNIYAGAHRIANVAAADENDVNATQILGRA